MPLIIITDAYHTSFRLSYIHIAILLMSTMTTTTLAVDYPSYRRVESIISTGGNVYLCMW
jgi:hypothetical protein